MVGNDYINTEETYKSLLPYNWKEALSKTSQFSLEDLKKDFVERLSDDKFTLGSETLINFGKHFDSCIKNNRPLSIDEVYHVTTELYSTAEKHSKNEESAAHCNRMADTLTKLRDFDNEIAVSYATAWYRKFLIGLDKADTRNNLFKIKESTSEMTVPVDNLAGVSSFNNIKHL